MVPPLSGLKVLDLSTVLAANCSRHCRYTVMHGRRSSRARSRTPPQAVTSLANGSCRRSLLTAWDRRREHSQGIGRTARAKKDTQRYFASVNVGKKALQLNLREPADVKVVHDLAKESDICLANFKGSDARKLKVCHDTLRGLNPRMIYANITGYGKHDSRPGFDAVVQAESGFTYLNGPPSTPTKMPVALVDILCAHQLKEAILLALYKREKSQEGSYVTCSLLGAATSALANQASGYLMTGKIPERIGSDHPSIAPYGTVFHAQGAPLVLAVGNDRHFEALAQTLGFSTAGYERNIDRCAKREELKALIAEKLKHWNREEFIDTMSKANVPAGAVKNMEEVFQHPEAQRLIVDAGSQRVVRQVAWEGDECAKLRPAPELSEGKQGLSRF